MKMFSIVVRVLGIVIFLLGLALAANAFQYINFDPHYGFLKLKQNAITTGWYLPAYYSHVLVAGVILIAGFVQVSRWGLRWKKLHRFLGYIYVMGILFFAAPGGLVMSMFIERGPWVLTSFILQSCLWFYFTAMAFNRIRKKDITNHRIWMWRSFALTFAAITLRLYAFVGSYIMDMKAPPVYATIAWISWGLNLIAIEIYLRNIKNTRHAFSM